MLPNQRQHPRFRVADLRGSLEINHPAVIVELTRSGATVETSERLVPERTYPLQLEGPEGLRVTTRGRVAWCRMTGMQEDDDGDSTPLYRAGLEFEEALPEAATRLLDRLDPVAPDTIDASTPAGYRMSDLATTLLLRERATFEVRVLGHGGMGVEMAYSPRLGSTLEIVLELDEPAEVHGRVASVDSADEDPTLFRVGIEFVGLTPTAQGRLERYLERLRRTPPEAL